MQGREKEAYENLMAAKTVGLEQEIYVLKAKYLVYLESWRERWERIAQAEGTEAADDKTRVFFFTGEQCQGV